ncbi:MAG: peptidylprolyl isomerase [Bacteroidetes bacterium]|nr:MAG: peptidylprolyl isomerase [Bacteroidota bacterium]
MMLLKRRNLKLIPKTAGLVLFIVASFGPTLSAQGVLIDGVLAVVGKNIVLKSDLNQAMEAQKKQNPQFEVDQCDVFEELLLEKLLLHQADLDSVEVSEEEVQANIDRRIEVFIQQIGSSQRLEQYYGKSILEIKEEMSELIRNQMTAQRMMQTINGDIEITPSEVRLFYNDIPKDSLPLINAEVKYAEIVKFPEVSEEAKQEAIDQLVNIKERILNGSSFSTMAVLYSDDEGSSKNGGEYKGIKRGQFVKEFEAIAFNLSLNEISDPFKTEYGYHIVQLQSKRGQELDLRHILIKPKISAENLEASKKVIDSVRTLILEGKISFEEAAKQFSDDEDSKLNGGLAVNPQSGESVWETGQLDKTIFYALENIEEGTMSPATFFRTRDEKEGYKLIKLIDRTEAHTADLGADYQRIQQVAKAQKQQKALEDWVNDKIGETYVRVNNEYLSCTFKRKWLNASQYAE